MVFERIGGPVQRQSSDEVADTEELVCPQKSDANYADDATLKKPKDDLDDKIKKKWVMHIASYVRKHLS